MEPLPARQSNVAPPKSSGVEAKAETGDDEHVTDTSMGHIINHIYVSPVKSALVARWNPSQKPLVNQDTDVTQVSSVEERGKGVHGKRNPQHRNSSRLARALNSEGIPKNLEHPKSEQILIPTQLTTGFKPGTPRLNPSTAGFPPANTVAGT